MNTINTTIRNLRRFAALAVLGAAFLATNCRAVSIEMWVLAKGTWAILVPNSNTGGRVVYSATYGWYITDRAARGETVSAYLSPSTAAERTNPSILRCWLTSTAGSKELRTDAPKMSTWVSNFTMPTSVFWDDNYINVKSVSGAFKVRIPCGGRP
jgi:hypothetical protein